MAAADVVVTSMRRPYYKAKMLIWVLGQEGELV